MSKNESETEPTTKAEKTPREPLVLNKIEGGPKRFFVGKKLFAVGEGNPRREGVPGHTSYQLIIDNPGITFAEFIERGGRIQDVAWDFERNRVRTEDDGSAQPAPAEESVEA